MALRITINEVNIDKPTFLRMGLLIAHYYGLNIEVIEGVAMCDNKKIDIKFVINGIDFTTHNATFGIYYVGDFNNHNFWYMFRSMHKYAEWKLNVLFK